MQLLLKAAVAAHVVARALLLVMLLLIPGLSTKEWCGRPIWRELSMPSGCEQPWLQQQNQKNPAESR